MISFMVIDVFLNFAFSVAFEFAVVDASVFVGLVKLAVLLLLGRIPVSSCSCFYGHSSKSVFWHCIRQSIYQTTVHRSCSWILILRQCNNIVLVDLRGIRDMIHSFNDRFMIWEGWDLPFCLKSFWTTLSNTMLRLLKKGSFHHPVVGCTLW